MHLHSVIETLHRGTQLAAAIETQNSPNLAFVGVYPLDLSNHMTQQFLRNNGIAIFPRSGRAYHIRTFEVDRKLINTDISIGETELINPQSHFSFDDQSLLAHLKRIGVDPERLELPYRSDYPI